MNAKYILSTAAALIVGFAVTVLAGAKPEAREELATAIPEGIRLLRDKRYDAFLVSFVPPETLEKIAREQSIHEFVDQFAESKAATLLQILQAIKGKEPKLDQDGRTATYIHGVKDAPHDTITFQKIGAYWYIKN